MSTPTLPPNKSGEYNLKNLVIGFILSVMLTLAAYFAVTNAGDGLSDRALICIVIGLALTQLLVQLLFFLHLGREEKPRLNLIVFAFMLVVIGIVAGGSLWIMHNLNYNMMPEEMNQHMLDQYKKGGI